jgi:anti-sigma regulatory factor (Ser/Thr protein kinase)
MSIAQPHVEPRDHAVRFYERDEELRDAVGRYLGDALGAGDTAIVAATSDHVLGFEGAMGGVGVQVANARASDRLIVIDADDMATRLILSEESAGSVFESSVGAIVRDAAERGRGVSVYGEIVAVLWAKGHVAAAIDLEARWNALRHETPFELLCAYPTGSVAGEEHGPALDEVCRLHSSVNGLLEDVDTTDQPDAAKAEVTERFERSVRSARNARRFVTATLQAWGELSLVEDAALIVTELATNAVAHARSDLVVTVSLRRRSIRVSVQDSSPDLPRVGKADLASPSGRGLTLVAALASRWGDGSFESGKVVWAELNRARQR